MSGIYHGTMKDETIEEARRVLLDFFRTQINTHIQTIVAIVIAFVSLVIAVLSKEISTILLPESFKLPVFFLGTGLLASLAFVQWGKTYWYGRLWNATLVAKPSSFDNNYEEPLEADYFMETGIARLFIGVNELLANRIKRYEAILIFLARETKQEIIFCVLVGLFSMSLYWLYYITIWRLIFFAILVTLLAYYLFWVIFENCCCVDQWKKWLESKELEHLVTGNSKHKSIIDKKKKP